DADPASAETIIAVCGRLPLFVNVTGSAVRNRLYTLAEYAAALRQRGLSALADEDERAAVVFDLSWRFVAKPAREVFAALALAPGDDVGPNLVAAWQRQPPAGLRAWLDPHRWLRKTPSPSSDLANLARRPLSELANASLLI